MDTETAAVFAEAGVKLRQFIPVGVTTIAQLPANINVARKRLDPPGKAELLLETR
jgi:hypothetical protein